MANLKEIRGRIKTVITTQQMTRAMKMVAAAKLGRAQKNIERLRPYASKLQKLMGDIAANVSEGIDSPYVESRNPDKVLLVVVTAGGAGGCRLCARPRHAGLRRADSCARPLADCGLCSRLAAEPACAGGRGARRQAVGAGSASGRTGCRCAGRPLDNDERLWQRAITPTPVRRSE